MAIGYIGLGEMGGALAERLLLRHELHVFDLNPEAVARLSAKGGKPCASLKALAEQCRTIFICLPTSAHVRAVIFGENGLAPHLEAGTLIIDQTTGDPVTTRTIGEELARKQVTLIDAPVSGGADGAKAGTISIMVGAEQSDFDVAQPLLAAISPNIFHCGKVGTGHVMKLVNNMLSGGQRLMTMESVALAAKNGIDPARAVEVLLAGGARNSFLERAMGPQLVKGNLGAQFSLGLMHKDLRFACQLGVDSSVPLFYGNLTRELYQMCANERGIGDKVNSAALVFDRLAGTKVVPSN